MIGRLLRPLATRKRGSKVKMRFPGVLLSLLGAASVMPAPAASNLAVIDQIDGPRGAWNFASIDPASRRLYVGRTDGILAVDLDSRKVTPLPLGGRRVQMVAPVPGSDLVVATLDDSNRAVLMNGRTGAVVKELPAGRGPEIATFDPASGLVAVMAASEELVLIDPARKTVAGRIPMGALLESGAADGHGRLYVNLEDKHAIGVVDLWPESCSRAGRWATATTRPGSGMTRRNTGSSRRAAAVMSPRSSAPRRVPSLQRSPSASSPTP